MAVPTITSLAQLTSTRPVMSAEKFDAWIETQTSDTIYELIAGEVVEVPSNVYVSLLAWYISVRIGNFLIDNKLGWASVEGGGYDIATERYAPDVAIMLLKSQRRPNKKGYNPVAPDIAIEIVSSNSAKEQETLRLKIAYYLLAGTIVLVVNSITESTELHVPGYPPTKGDYNSKITFGDVLPGFVLDMKDIFDFGNDIETDEEE